MTIKEKAINGDLIEKIFKICGKDRKAIIADMRNFQVEGRNILYRDEKAMKIWQKKGFPENIEDQTALLIFLHYKVSHDWHTLTDNWAHDKFKEYCKDEENFKKFNKNYRVKKLINILNILPYEYITPQFTHTYVEKLTCENINSFYDQNYYKEILEFVTEVILPQKEESKDIDSAIRYIASLSILCTKIQALHISMNFLYEYDCRSEDYEYQVFKECIVNVYLAIVAEMIKMLEYYIFKCRKESSSNLNNSDNSINANYNSNLDKIIELQKKEKQAHHYQEFLTESLITIKEVAEYRDEKDPQNVQRVYKKYRCLFKKHMKSEKHQK